MIHKVYPSLPEGFYDILCERIKAHGFTDYELTKAVNHVIDTCKYPTPVIAEFISFVRPDGKDEQTEDEPTPEELQAIKEEAEAYQKKLDDWNERMLAGEFENEEE